MQECSYGLDIPMELNQDDGHWRVTLDLPDGIYHYQYKVVTKSWFEPEPEPALPDYTDDDTKTADENEQIRKNYRDEYEKRVQEVKERNKKREEEITFTEVWYTFVDPYATVVDERGSDDAFRSVGILIFKNGDFQDQFKDVTAKMDYFVGLGVTAVEIMPIKEFPGKIGWGYTPRYYFAIESAYGTTVELKEMIDTFHKHGIRVIMDGVYNHCDVSAPYTAIDHDYWFHHEPKDRTNSWGPEWNYERYDEKFKVWPARKYIADSVRYFINEFHTDGTRFDAATQINHEEFLGSISQSARDQARDRAFAHEFLCVGEYLPDRIESVLSNGGPMDSIWHECFYWKLRDAIVFDAVNWNDLKDIIDGRRRGYKNIVDIVNYQSNHDHDRMLVELGKERQIFDQDAFRRVRMAFTIQATSFGLMMIWMGEEIGEYKEKTPDVAKLDWSLIEDRQDNVNAINKEHLQYYKNVIQLRKLNSALTAPNLEFIYEHIDNQILVWHRWNNTTNDIQTQENHIIIICNWSSTTYENYEILNIPRNGHWYEWLNNDKEYVVENNKLILENLIDHSVRILVYQMKKCEEDKVSVG
ncbi:hypothetical protein I4U23_029437 [Adineta vaga]|nr:hypothetical protein I4U23_029437 [Adineta vaga]